MPTMLDLAGLTHPAPGPGNGTYRGREVFPMRGKSWTSYFTADTPSTDRAAIHTNDDPAVGWEMYGRAALRKGDWKILWMPLDAHGKAKWELFNLSVDPGEIDDLAESRPDKLQELLVEWEKYVKETGVVWGAPFSDAGIEDWLHLPEDSVGACIAIFPVQTSADEQAAIPSGRLKHGCRSRASHYPRSGNNAYRAVILS